MTSLSETPATPFPGLRNARVLLVDDDPDIHRVVGEVLTASGAVVLHAATNAEAMRIVNSRTPFDIALVDLLMASESGLTVIRRIRRDRPAVPITVITGQASGETAVSLDAEEVRTALIKPFTPPQLLFTLNRELARVRTAGLASTLPADATGADPDGLVGRSGYMNGLREQIRRLGDTDLPVLIQGPTGTGKEILARAIHRNSRRKKRDMITVNSSAIPEQLEESEFFGHARGAFTGAQQAKDGIIRCADGSTLFLDEVGDLSLRIQAKLLRVLDGHEFFRVGETLPQRSDFRLVSATNRPLQDMVAAGTFRADLYYRLKSGMILTRPLSIHSEDIPDLVRHFLFKFREKENRNIMVSHEAMVSLQNYEYPGNIRELRNLVLTLCASNPESGVIEKAHVQWIVAGKEREYAAKDISFSEAKLEFEKNYYKCLLQKYNGNITHAAREADLERAYFSKRLKLFAISSEDFKPSRSPEESV